MNRLFLGIAFGTLTFSQAFSQSESNPNNEKQEVYAIIEELFDAYRAGDSARIRATFSSNAKMMRASYKDGKSIASENSVDSFIKYVGDGLSQIHNELLWDYEIFIDDNLANMWTKYAFFLDGKFHHCGSETFTLYRSDSGWKIIFLADNSITEGCEVPEKIKNKGEKKLN
jgi:hypothetical protein